MALPPRSSSLHRATAHNELLNAIPPEVRARMEPFLELVPLRLGEVLYEPGVVQQYVFFPVDCIVSLLYVLENGQSAEIAVVGFEGMVGESLLMGGGSTPNRAVVQSAGNAFRLSASHIQELTDKGGRCFTSCCATRSRSSPRCRKRQCATGTIRSNSNCAAGYC